VLCLLSGERIKLKKQIRLLFETDSLVNITPATISRCGMLYLPDEALPITDLVKLTLSSFDLHTTHKSELETTIFTVLPDALAFICGFGHELNEVPKVPL
jgi:dynein heavy chain